LQHLVSKCKREDNGGPTSRQAKERKMKPLCSVLVWAACAAIVPAASAADAPDTILYNGKIVTVDDRFTIAQAVALRGQRMAAVGPAADMLMLKGEGTRLVDLGGKTVIPGLIDNHAHFIRAPEHDELRLDGVTSRKEALAMLAARVKAARPGEWVATLGGW